jgi:hypothetical protein
MLRPLHKHSCVSHHDRHEQDDSYTTRSLGLDSEYMRRHMCFWMNLVVVKLSRTDYVYATAA